MKFSISGISLLEKEDLLEFKTSSNAPAFSYLVYDMTDVLRWCTFCLTNYYFIV